MRFNTVEEIERLINEIPIDQREKMLVNIIKSLPIESRSRAIENLIFFVFNSIIPVCS
jgi:hypothetical protein